MHPSDEKLSTALHEAGLQALAQRAAAGEFNDFFTDSATPKMDLVEALMPAATTNPAAMALIDAVRRGEFDSGRDEADEWGASPEGREMKRRLIG